MISAPTSPSQSYPPPTVPSYPTQMPERTPSIKRNYTLAGTPVWQKAQRSKHINQFSLRERTFIHDALTSEVDPNLTGSRVVYMEPEGSDRHLSLLSLPDILIGNEAEPGEGEGDKGIGMAPNPRKGMMMRIAKRIPGQVYGGAKVLGNAMRRPVTTTRQLGNLGKRRRDPNEQKPRRYLFRKNKNELPPLRRTATFTAPETLPCIAL